MRTLHQGIASPLPIARAAIVAVFASLSLLQVARAQSETASLPIMDAPPGTTALGAGVRVPLTPYTHSEDQRDIVPLYLYEGRTAFVHGTSIGAHVWRHEGLTIDVLGRYRFWQLDPEPHEQLEGIRARRQTVDAGLALALDRSWGRFRAEWLTDLLDRHEGDELKLSYRYGFELDAWSLSPYVELGFLDDELSNYYFGVSEEESTEGRPQYLPGRSVNFGYGINTSYSLAPNFELFANLGITELDSGLFESPLVDKALDPSVFVGGNYYFGSTLSRPEAELGPRSGEWSWRLNLGYQAQGQIVGEIDQGDFSRSVDADTGIAGLTLSKLVNEGERADYYGRFALFRHLEGDAQRNFFSVAAYVMAMGEGYSPWSDEVSFRWGFGMGLSYGQRVPVVEQIKQKRDDENTSRFLNYLEMTVDFPVDRILSGERFDDCFVGLTTVHRSGIFGSSDLLGDVAGGSDWITLHWECLR